MALAYEQVALHAVRGCKAAESHENSAAYAFMDIRDTTGIPSRDIQYTGFFRPREENQVIKYLLIET